MQVTHIPSHTEYNPVHIEASIKLILTETEAQHFADLIGNSSPLSRRDAFGEYSDSDILVDIFRVIRKHLAPKKDRSNDPTHNWK